MQSGCRLQKYLNELTRCADTSLHRTTEVIFNMADAASRLMCLIGLRSNGQRCIAR